MIPQEYYEFEAEVIIWYFEERQEWNLNEFNVGSIYYIKS